VQPLGEVYANESRTVMLKRGSNGKTVIRRMKVPVMLKLENPAAYEVYAVDTSGARLGKVPAIVKDGRLAFMANTEFAPGTGVIAWEVVRVAMDESMTKTAKQAKGKNNEVCKNRSVLNRRDNHGDVLYGGGQGR